MTDMGFSSKPFKDDYQDKLASKSEHALVAEDVDAVRDEVKRDSEDFRSREPEKTKRRDNSETSRERAQRHLDETRTKVPHLQRLIVPRFPSWPFASFILRSQTGERLEALSYSYAHRMLFGAVGNSVSIQSDSRVFPVSTRKTTDRLHLRTRQ